MAGTSNEFKIATKDNWDGPNYGAGATAGTLDAAGGNGKNLVLGRFDRLEGGWTLLPTTVDTNAMTLIATTNRFSIWVVMASDKAPAAPQDATGSTKQSPAPTPLLVCGLVALFLLVKCKRKNT
jgi:hypothetical protein